VEPSLRDYFGCINPLLASPIGDVYSSSSYLVKRG
jgi:hypothetical protein